MADVASLISSVGFPIAMCVLIMYYWNVQFTKEMDELQDVVSQLNVSIIKLVEKMGGVDDGNSD